MKYLSQSEGFAVNVSYGNSLLHSQLVKGEYTFLFVITFYRPINLFYFI